MCGHELPSFLQVCRKATYGYDQRVEFFGTEGLVKHENHFPSAVQKWTGTSVQQADLPHAFFMTRYADAYKNETRVRRRRTSGRRSAYFRFCLLCKDQLFLSAGGAARVDSALIP